MTFWNKAYLDYCVTVWRKGKWYVEVPNNKKFFTWQHRNPKPQHIFVDRYPCF